MIQAFLDDFGAGKKEASDTSRAQHKDQSKYWSGIGKMMHTMRWSRPDVYNAT